MTDRQDDERSAQQRGKVIDTAWREMLLPYVEDAIEFFLPDLAAKRDRDRPIDMLDNEFRRLGSDNDKGKRLADAVFSVPLKNGGCRCITFIVEQQHKFDEDFGLRMFEEYYRALDKYQLPVTMLAIFTSAMPSAERYILNEDGMEISFGYNVYKVIDSDTEALKRDDRLFAAVALAARRMLDAGGDPRRRSEYARELKSLLDERSYPVGKIKDLMLFIVRALRLKENDIDRTTKEELDMIGPTLAEAVKEINERNSYELGEYAGEIKGWHKGRAEVVRNALQMGMNIDDIVKLTSLSRNEIESLRNA